MAFETVQIHSTLDSASPESGSRYDLVVSNVVLLSLTSTVGVASYRWQILGRPEGSSAGGAGPEPIELGSAITATFTVDTDSGYKKDGSYIVSCLINENLPTQTRVTAELVRLSGLTTNDGRALRMLGAFEVNEDTLPGASVNQGWATAANRWLRYLQENAGGGGGSGLSYASWAVGTVRYYLIDYDGGNDSNTGYIDAAPGDTLVPAGLAFKTLEQFFSVVPRYGNGRQLVLLIKPRAAGAAYLKKDGVTTDSIDFSGIGGYSLLVRGSTDLTNSAEDKIRCGGIVDDTGPGTGGLWAVDVDDFDNNLNAETLTPASGSFAAADTLVGRRVRYTGNVSPGLALSCNVIVKNTTGKVWLGDEVNCGIAVTGDTFYIEKPGVLVASVKDQDFGSLLRDSGYGVIPPGTWVGIATNGNSGTPFLFGPGAGGGGEFASVAISFCEQVAAGTAFGGQNQAYLEELVVSTFYTDEAETTIITGTGFRSGGQVNSLSAKRLFVTHSAFLAGLRFTADRYFVGAACYLRGTTMMEQCSMLPVYPNLSPAEVGTIVGFSETWGFGAGHNYGYSFARIDGLFNAVKRDGLVIRYGHAQLYGVSFENCANCISPQGNGQTINIDVAVSGGGNTGYGLELEAGCTGARIGVGQYDSTTITVAGTLGDIHMPNAVALWTGLPCVGVLRDPYNDNAIAGRISFHTPNPTFPVSCAGTGNIEVGLVYAAAGVASLKKADGGALTQFVGVTVFEPKTPGSTQIMYLTRGPLAWIQFDAIAAPNIGDTVYLSATPGLASQTPSASKLGYLVTTAGPNAPSSGNTLCLVALNLVP